LFRLLMGEVLHRHASRPAVVTLPSGEAA
jgi:hypothetical protein